MSSMYMSLSLGLYVTPKLQYSPWKVHTPLPFPNQLFLTLCSTPPFTPKRTCTKL